MFKRVFKLFQIARKLSISGAIDTINQVHQIPVPVNLFFSLISLGSKNTRLKNNNPGQNLCEALQGMGTTFIKLGQFLATRPDIIGEEMAKDLEKLQDKVPAFELYEAKKVIKKEIGEKQYQNIIQIGEPIAAASIAQVHFAKIKNENQIENENENENENEKVFRQHKQLQQQQRRRSSSSRAPRSAAAAPQNPKSPISNFQIP